jgi:Cu-Zn family superoxide dismutase
MRLGLIIVALLVLIIPVEWAISSRRGTKCGDCNQQIVAALRNNAGKNAGTASFKQVGDKLNITLDLKNLPPGQHAVYLHAKPLCEAPDYATVGPHFNPEGKQHGLLNPLGHHAGDLPNIFVEADGTANASFAVNSLSLGTGWPNSIYKGESLVIHDMPDDLKDDPDGFAGKPIACGLVASGD